MAPDHPHQMVAAVLPHALLRIAASGLGTHGGLTRIPAVVVAQVSRLIDGSATVWILGRGSDEAPLTASNHTPAARTALQDQAASTDTSIPARPDLTGATQPTALDILGPYTLIPVTGDNHRLGMIAVSRDPGHPPFTPGDVGALHTVADLCAVVLQQARMLNDSLIALEELRTQVEQPSQVSDALIVCDPTMRILNWNTGAERIYGYPHSEALGCDLFALLATHRLEPDGQPSPNDPHDTIRDLQTGGGCWRGELRERRADGTTLNIMSTISVLGPDTTSHSGAVLVISRDITDQRRQEYHARHDPLTGLANRRALHDRLQECTRRAQRTRTNLAVAFIDLDGFKPVNDTHGHAVGDQVLCTIAARLAATVRGNDLVARLGGDEFAVILESAGTRDTITTIANRLHTAIAEPILIDATTTVRVTASIGIDTIDHGDTPADPQHTLDAADRAMYHAKHHHTGTAFATRP